MTVIWFRPCVWAILASLVSAARHIRVSQQEAPQEAIEAPDWTAASYRQLKGSKKAKSDKSGKGSSNSDKTPTGIPSERPSRNPANFENCSDTEPICGYSVSKTTGELEELFPICYYGGKYPKSMCVALTHSVFDNHGSVECGCCTTGRQPSYCDHEESICGPDLRCITKKGGRVESRVCTFQDDTIVPITSAKKKKGKSSSSGTSSSGGNKKKGKDSTPKSECVDPFDPLPSEYGYTTICGDCLDSEVPTSSPAPSEDPTSSPAPSEDPTSSMNPSAFPSVSTFPSEYPSLAPSDQPTAEKCLDEDQDVCGFTTSITGEVEDMVAICVLDASNQYRSDCVRRSEREGETVIAGEEWQGCGCCVSDLGLGSGTDPAFCSLPEPQCPVTLSCGAGPDGLLLAQIYYWDTSENTQELRCVDRFFKDNNNGEDVIFCGNANTGFALTDDCDKDDPAKFNICLYIEYIDFDAITAYERSVKGRDLWESIIVEDDGPPTITPDLGELAFFSGEGYVPWRFPLSIDDIAIALFYDASRRPTLGTAQVAGMKTVTATDGEEYTHAYAATLILNTRLFDVLEGNDPTDLYDPPEWDNLVAHELGHSLGFATLWVQNNLFEIGTRIYKGAFATDKWKEIGCSGSIPVESNGQHFDETCLNPELMTLSSEKLADDPLSILTIGTMQDLGYGVDYTNANLFELADIRGGECQMEFDFVTCPEGTAPDLARRQLHPLDGAKHTTRSEGGYLSMMCEAGNALQHIREHNPSSDHAVIM
jgi:hypothetical protein